MDAIEHYAGMNQAYRAGVRHCLELLDEEIQAWTESNNGACSDDLTQVDVDTLRDRFLKLYTTPYIK